MVPYAASKHGLVGMTHTLRAEYAGSGVGFSVVCPGFVTQAGMYDRWVHEGVKAPRVVGSSKPDKVASVVLDCIRRNRAEVLVNTPPIKGLVVLATLAPAICPKMLHLFGYTRMLRKGAETESVR